MLNINRVLKDNRLMKATAGLSIEEFLDLKEVFQKAVREMAWKKYESGKRKGNRQRMPGGGSKGSLNNTELKLFFILVYFKCYPTMDLMGLFFDVDRSCVKKRVDRFTPILEIALGKKKSLPKRKISTLEEFIQVFPETKDLFIDGTERPVQRPKNQKKQKKHYSGKKKRHTKKNIVISDENNRIGYLSKTKSGKNHDYPMFKEKLKPEIIPKNISFWLDKGFTGIKKDYPGMDSLLPKRKPRGKELSDYDKEQNKTISGIRILSEHAIGGAKRLKITTDSFRNKSDKFNDTVMCLACGLWNYHLDSC
jgi:hypothetical protein